VRTGGRDTLPQQGTEAKEKSHVKYNDRMIPDSEILWPRNGRNETKPHTTIGQAGLFIGSSTPAGQRKLRGVSTDQR
jgi:hypothetical protein